MGFYSALDILLTEVLGPNYYFFLEKCPHCNKALPVLDFDFKTNQIVYGTCICQEKGKEHK